MEMENETKAAPLDRIIAILREELSLAARLHEQAEAQRKALKDNLNGKAVTDATEAAGPTLQALDACEKNKAALLAELGVGTFADALGRMPYSREKMRARQYMDSLDRLLKELRETVGASRELLARDMDYLAFTLNVMTEASAGAGYGTPEAPVPATQGRKLFDQSI